MKIPESNLEHQTRHRIKPRYRHSLRLKFAAIIAGTVLLISAGIPFFVITQFSQISLVTINHEGILLSDAVEAAIVKYLPKDDFTSMQSYIDKLVYTRELNDIEINVIKLIDSGNSEIVVSNNSSNIEATDEEEHAALLEALEAMTPHIDIETPSFEIDPDDDLSTYEDPEHPDHYIPPGFRVMSITKPLIIDNNKWGSINTDISLQYLDLKLQNIYRSILTALAAAVILLIFGLIILMNRNFINPLWNLADKMYRFKSGDSLESINIKERFDEIGVLNNEFMEMVQRLNKIEAANTQYRDHLEELVNDRTKELLQTQEATILSMASLAETRDPETGAHIRRTQNYVKLLAEYLRNSSRFSHFLNETNIDLLYKSAPLHDIGKVGIKDDILLKPGKLTDEEYEAMKLHTVYGQSALSAAEETLGSNSFLRLAKEIAYTHQEKWDGSGYPQGLKGEEIPVSGRLMAIADVYDALISKRVYKPAFSHEKAMDIIRQGRGSHFDPDIVDAFLDLEDQIKGIAETNAD
jgi:response regulator RpfG family c-di-GMP phosphodiesterase